MKPKPVTYVDHTDSMECWCHPTVFFEWGDRMVLVHKGNGEELPPAKVLVKAMADIIANRSDDDK